MVSVSFSLEHFYYGQPVRDGEPETDLRLLAKSPGLTDDQIEAAVKQVLLPPMAGTSNGSWGIVRGKTIPAVMVQAQLGTAGQTILHYIVLAPEVLRAMTGNLRALRVLVEDSMPVFEKPVSDLPPLELPQGQEPTSDEQVDDILDLMTFVKNRMETMESLLSAIVKGVQVVVIGAPPALDTRVKFISGLLALLPPSTRFGVTFATHSTAASQADVQIRFMGDDIPPHGTLIYNWSNSQITGKVVDDDYSHYTISKLRLDTNLVIQQTQELAGVAAWRFKQGDRLADAMGYASQRLRLDDALRNNQPVEIDDVSRILAEDPTLTDELRTIYARHLLTFSLALGDMSHADPVAILLRNNPDLSKVVCQQIGDELTESSKAGMIYETLLRWMANPLGPQGNDWIDLTHRAALLHLKSIAEVHDFDAIHTFLNTIQAAGPGAAIRRAASQIADLVIPLIPDDSILAERVFLLAIQFMDAGVLTQMLNAKTIVTRLPRQVAAARPFLLGANTDPAPLGLLKNAAWAFDEEWHALVVLRLAELAVATGRPDLLDAPTLSSILEAAQSPMGVEYADALLGIVRSFSDTALKDLGESGARYLLQILLVLGKYRELAREMIRHSRELYPGDLQEKYVAMVQHVFAETPLTPEQALTALQTINEEGIRLVPYLVAATGALEASKWADELEPIAEDVTSSLFANPDWLEVINAESVLALVNFHARRKDVPNAIRAASLVPTAAANQEETGLDIMTRLYKLMAWDNRAKVAGLELLRQYVRKAEAYGARQAVTHFGRDLGPDVQRSLQVTYTIKRFMGTPDIVDYAQYLHAASEFLQDCAAAYAGHSSPSAEGLLATLEALSAHIPERDRHDMHNAAMALGKAVVTLGKQYRSNSPRNLGKHTEQLLTGKDDPASALDVFRVMGGYFGKSKQYHLKIGSVENPLRDRTTDQFMDAVQAARDVLNSAAQAFPADKPVKITTESVHHEMDSIWGGLSTDQQRELVRDLAIDLQRIVDLVDMIADNGDAKAMDDSGLGQKLDTGRQRPKSALEMFRFVAGYFK